MSKAIKMSETQINFLRHLAGQGERPKGVAIGNIKNALLKRGLIESVPQENGTYRSVPTELGRQYL